VILKVKKSAIFSTKNSDFLLLILPRLAPYLNDAVKFQILSNFEIIFDFLGKILENTRIKYVGIALVFWSVVHVFKLE
jgi:hypothetical protein